MPANSGLGEALSFTQSSAPVLGTKRPIVYLGSWNRISVSVSVSGSGKMKRCCPPHPVPPQPAARDGTFDVLGENTRSQKRGVPP